MNKIIMLRNKRPKSAKLDKLKKSSKGKTQGIN